MDRERFVPQGALRPQAEHGTTTIRVFMRHPPRMNRSLATLGAVALTALACALAANYFRSPSPDLESIALGGPPSISTSEKRSAPSPKGKWGTLKGQILLTGEIPRIPPVVSAGDSKVKDASLSAVQDIPSEALLVDPETKGIANGVLFLVRKPAVVHSAAVRSKQKEVVFKLKNFRYEPHVMLVRTDQRIRVVSSDPVLHSVHSYPKKNVAGPVNIVLERPPDDTGILLPLQSEPERLPVKVVCDIHPWMSAYWVILDHPYAAITDSNGHYEIPNLPVGEHQFVIWHESAGVLDKAFAVSIEEGVNVQRSREFTAAEILK